MRRFILFLGVLLPMAFSGCGSSTLIEVSGSVTYDGQPLPEGDITFRPEDPHQSAEAGKIKNGEFRVQVPHGKHKVQITAARELPRPAGQKGAMGETTYSESYIPARYNTNTELSADVRSGEKNQLSFNLESKKN